MKTIQAPIKIFVTLLILSSTSIVYAESKRQVYIYDGQAAGDQRAIVFNNLLNEVSVQNKSSAAIDSEPYAFGGSFRYCSSKHYYCILGPLNIVIPKDIGEFKYNWRYKGVVCRARTGLQRGVYTVMCKLDASGVESVVEFSPLRGILSFKNTPIGAGSLFRLRGCKGIFSR